MDNRNYTDNLIDTFFQNNQLDDENFFQKLETKIKTGQKDLKTELDFLLKENELNALTINRTKDDYFEKLEQITHLHNNYEYRVDNINKHYSDKLAYISVLSNALGEYEKFDANISYANKIFDLVQLLNESEDINKIIPDIFTNPDKMLDQGIEVFEAFRQIIDVASNIYPIFVKNFKIIESKMKLCIQESIKDFYENNDLNKLEKLMKVTEILNSDFIIDFYVQYIIEQMHLDNLIKSLKDLTFENMSEDLRKQVFNIIDEFYNNIIKGGALQYGHEASKIYLIFPESRQKLVISSLILQISKKIMDFRDILKSEKGKTDETFVKIIEYIYPKSLQFTNDFKESLIFTKTDLWNSIEQETTIFLRGIEAVYMNKERNILNSFIRNFFDAKIKQVSEIKRNYESGTYKIEQFQNETFFLITETKLSNLNDFTITTIKRYHSLIGNKDEKIDLTESFCKSILDSVKSMLEAYCALVKMLLNEREKQNLDLTEHQYYILYKLNFILNDFSQIFLNELKDFFKSIKFYDELEDSVKRRVEQIKFSMDNLFSQLSSYTSGTLNNMLKLIKYKDTYNGKPASLSEEKTGSTEMEKVINFLRPLFITVRENWPEFYKKKVCQLITKIIIEKMIDIMKNAKFTESGSKLMKSDFQRINKVFMEYLEEFYSMQISDIVFLAEIFMIPKEDVDSFIQSVNLTNTTNQRFDPELLKVLAKKRKGLKF